MKSIAQVFSFDVISKVIVGIVSLTLIRFMPENQFALYTVAFALAVLITEILSASFNRIYIVGYQELGFKELSSAFLGFQITLVVLLVVLALPFQSLLQNTFWAVAFLILVNCILGFYKTTYQQKSNFISFSIIELLKNVAFAAGVLFFIYLERCHLQAVSVLAVQSVAMLLVIVLFHNRIIDSTQLFNLKSAANVATKIIRGKFKYLFGYFLVLSIFVQLDVVMLKFLSDNSALATYGSAFRYYGILLLLLESIHTVLLPAIQQIKDFTRWQEILDRLKKIFIGFVCVAFFAGWAAQWLIPWIDNGKYPEAVTVFRVLVVSAVISMRCSPHVNLLISFSDFKYLTVLIIFGSLIKAVLNVALIPLWGSTGTAVATLVSSAFATVLIYFRVSTLVKSRFP